uniref:Sperm-activating peptide (Ser-3,5,7 speract) n=1 Tax=Heliocidaris crassispina TaxID=1043166 RepID=Q7M4D8_HELCR
GFSLSGSGVG